MNNPIIERITHGLGAVRAKHMRKFDPNTDKVFVDFGGLYETWHRQFIEQMECREFEYKYIERYPDDQEFAKWSDACGGCGGYAELLLSDSVTDAFNKLWQYDFQAAAFAYLTEMLSFINHEYGLTLELDSIDWTRDNFSRPDLMLLKPIGDANMRKVIEWLRDNPDVQQGIIELVRCMTTARDGYAPFYTFEQVMNDDGWLLRLTLECMVERCCDWDADVDCNWYEHFQFNSVCNMPDFGKWGN